MKKVTCIVLCFFLFLVAISQDVEKAMKYYENKQYEEAAFEFEKVLPFIEKEYGETDTSYYSKQVFFTARAFENSEQYPKAEHYYLIVKSIFEFHQDTLNQIYTLTLLYLGYSYIYLDLYDKAEQTNKRALELVKIRSGENHLEYAAILDNLAITYEKTRHYNLAEPLVQQAIEISRTELGVNSTKHAEYLNHLGSIYNATRNYKKAVVQINKALEIVEKQLGQSNLFYANYTCNLGITYEYMGNYVMAETLFKQALEITKPKPGKELTSDYYYYNLLYLAGLYRIMNRYSESEILYLKVLEFYKDKWDSNHREYASMLNGLVNLYSLTGQYQKAETMILKAIEIDKTKLGKEHPNYARDLYRLGNINKDMGQYNKAESNYIEAIEIVEKELNNNYLGYALFINNLARLYTLTGEFEKAEVFFKRALEINKNQLGVNHPRYASTLNNLAELYIIQGDYIQANTIQRQAFSAYQYQIKNNTSYLSEKELKQFLHTFLYQIEIYQSLNSHQLQSQFAIGDFSYDIELIRKGILLKSSLGIKSRIFESGDASLVNAYYDLRSLRQKINKLKMKAPEERTQDPNELESQANELEKTLSLKSKDYELSQLENETSWENVKLNLKTDEAAIEFSSFHNFNGKELNDSILYCAVILTKEDSIPQMVYLFEESELIKVIPYAGATYRNINYTYQEPDLYNLIWQPIDSLLEGINTIYFAPSGLLNSISMAAIPCPDNKVLMDKYNLVQLSSTRTLAFPADPVVINDVVVYGGINYDTDSLTLRSTAEKYKEENDDLAYYRSYTGDLRSGFKYLPGSQQEAESISSKLEEKDIPFTSYSGTEAVEESFLSLSGNDAPSVIHLSTHGFYFPDTVSDENRKNVMHSSTGEIKFRYNDDPLQRSGLLMAGSNLAWKGQTIPDNIEDGILTAKEVSNMNLMNTELVVLSACQSGLGDVKGSEGVEGLQRGFKMAGVRYIIMSLWQVPDKETTEFMETFYDNWLESDDIHEAFRTTQITMKSKYQDDPFKWAGFVLME